MDDLLDADDGMDILMRVVNVYEYS